MARKKATKKRKVCVKRKGRTYCGVVVKAKKAAKKRKKAKR